MIERPVIFSYVSFKKQRNECWFRFILNFQVCNNYNAMFYKSFPLPGAMKYAGLAGRPYFRSAPPASALPRTSSDPFRWSHESLFTRFFLINPRHSNALPLLVAEIEGSKLQAYLYYRHIPTFSTFNHVIHNFEIQSGDIKLSSNNGRLTVIHVTYCDILVGSKRPMSIFCSLCTGTYHKVVNG